MKKTMATSAQELYTQTVRNLPPTERLKLATLILNGLVDQASSNIEESETWTEQAQNELWKSDRTRLARD